MILQEGLWVLAGTFALAGYANDLRESLKNFAESTTKSDSNTKGNYSWGNEATLEDHFNPHGADVGASSPEEYAKIANEFYNNRVNYQVKVDSKGTIRVYDSVNNIFGSYNADGTTRTLFSPTRGQLYFDSQPGNLIP